MTAPAGPIVFNNSTGSDTAASGLGPATAVTGTAAAHTNGAASTTITLTNSPDLSGVTAGHLLWLNTASGRQFSVIASVDDGADTVTVDDSFNIASGSAVDYAIGGKRSTFDNADSRTLFGSAGALPGWTIETETDQTLTSVLTLAANGSTTTGCINLVAASPHSVINQTTNAAVLDFTGSEWGLSNLKLTNSGGTKTNSHGILLTKTSGRVLLANCIIGDATDTLNHGVNRGGSGQMRPMLFRTEICFCTGNGIENTGGSGSLLSITNCTVHDNTGIGVRIQYGSGSYFPVIDTLIYNNGGDGIQVNSSSNTSLPHIQGCSIWGNGGDGIQFDGTVNLVEAVIIRNILGDNGGANLRMPANTDGVIAVCDFNAFYASTGGDRVNISAGANDIALSADPFVDAANGDFNINNTAGGGASLRAATLAMPA